MSDHVEAVVVGDSDRARSPRLRRGFVGSLPGFTYILILYVIGKYAFHNPRAPIFSAINSLGLKSSISLPP